MTNIWQHIESTVSMAVGRNLHHELGIKKDKLTRLQNGTSDWTIDEIERLGQLLQRDPIELIMQYRIGMSQISVEELDDLLKSRGKRLDFVDL